MALSLTSPEKKVLGFVVLMTVLGLVMLGIQRWQARDRTAEGPEARATATKVP